MVFTHHPVRERSEVAVYKDEHGKLYGAYTYRREGNSGCYAEMWELDDAGTELTKRLFTDKERDQTEANTTIQREVRERKLTFVRQTAFARST